MTDPNIHNISLHGTFDDCQAIVKASFNDKAFRDRNQLAAVNSINWARILAQQVYYVYAYLRVTAAGDATAGKKVSFTVPTGNFGDILAGYYAKHMGLPVDQMVVATNRNDILDRFFTKGDYSLSPNGVAETITPSMDIGISSNFERFLFHRLGENTDEMAALMKVRAMRPRRAPNHLPPPHTASPPLAHPAPSLPSLQNFESTGDLKPSKALLEASRAEMDSASVPDEEILTTIADVYKEGNGYTLDPHSAIGVAAARKARKPNATDVPMIVLACAHWAKFPDANKAALGAEKVSERRPTRTPAPAARGRRPRRRPTARPIARLAHTPSPSPPPSGGEADGPADPRRPPQARLARQVAAQRRLDRAGLRRGDDGGARRHRRAGGGRQGADGVSGAPRADAASDYQRMREQHRPPTTDHGSGDSLPPHPPCAPSSLSQPPDTRV